MKETYDSLATGATDNLKDKKNVDIGKINYIC